MRLSPSSLAMSMLAALALAGCSEDPGGPGSDDPLSLSFAVPRTSVSARSAALVPITDGTTTLDLQSVDLTISEIAIARVRDDDDDDDRRRHGSRGGGDGGRVSHKIRAGATTVSLPLAGGVITPIGAALPNGTYDELRFEIAFVRARGTAGGQPFDLTVEVNETLKLNLVPPFAVDSADDRLNVTVTVDLQTWFIGADSKLIDPHAVQLNPMLLRGLTHRIRASFRAFEDANRDADDSNDGARRHGRR